MRTYEVWVTETTYSCYKVKAENKIEAREKAKNAYNNWEEPFGTGATELDIESCEEVDEDE